MFGTFQTEKLFVNTTHFQCFRCSTCWFILLDYILSLPSDVLSPWLSLSFSQITDLDRRMSAIETFLNHLEQKVGSSYDLVNSLNVTSNFPNYHHDLYH